VFGGGIDLAEDEMLEQDRGEEGEVDDSLDPQRFLRILSIDQADALPPKGTNARKRRQWQVSALRRSVAHRRNLTQ